MTETPLSTVLHATARNVDKLVNTGLTTIGLTGARLEALAAYADNPGSANADMARACGISAQSGTYITTALIGRGWVVLGDADGLRRPVHVTGLGLEALGAGRDAVRPVDKRLAALLGAAGVRRLLDTADAIAADIDDLRPEPEEDPRFAQVGNAATGLYYRALMWADAHKVHAVPVAVVRRWSSPQAGVANRLVDAGLWKQDGDDYRIR